MSTSGRATCCEASPHTKGRLRRTDTVPSKSCSVWQLTQSPLSRVVGPAVPCLGSVSGGSRLGIVPMRPDVQASPRGLELAVEACPAAALASGCSGSLSMLLLCSIHVSASTPVERRPLLLLMCCWLGCWPGSGISRWPGPALPSCDARPAMEERKARSCSCLRGAAVPSAGTTPSSGAKCTTAAALSATPPGPALHLAGAEFVKLPLGQLPLQL